MSPRVLIAVPCLDMVAADFAFALSRLVLHGGCSATVIDCRGSDIVGARNTAARMALDGDANGEAFTHLLFLDSDMSFPADTLARLLASGKPVIGATYVRRCAPYNLLGAFEGSVPSTGVIEALEMPTGCLLINVAVLRKLSWPWFAFEYGENAGERIGEDIWFCRKVREAGVKIWADMDLTKEMVHCGMKGYTVADGIEYVRRQRAEGK